MMDGLAGQLASEPAGGAPTQGGMQGGMLSVEEIAALLMQGIDPQELVDQGVPPELIMEAIALLEQQMAAQSAQPSLPAQQAPVEEQGLAAQSVRM